MSWAIGGSYKASYHSDRDMFNIVDIEGDYVCSNVEQECDAHLIAAAPDLYEALKDLMNSFGDFENESDGRIGYTKEMLLRLRNSDAALAKARGEL